MDFGDGGHEIGISINNLNMDPILSEMISEGCVLGVGVIKLAFQAFNMAVLDKSLKNRDLALFCIGKYRK